MCVHNYAYSPNDVSLHHVYINKSNQYGKPAKSANKVLDNMQKGFRYTRNPKELNPQ